MKKIKRALFVTLFATLIILILFSLAGADIFEQDILVGSLLVSFFCCGLPSFAFKVKDDQNKGKAQKEASSSSSGSTKYRPTNYTDFWDERNIPVYWVKARACVDGDHDGTTVSQGNATRCYKCGLPFEGQWGDRGAFDGYFCQQHKKFISRGSYCGECAREGLIKTKS